MDKSNHTEGLKKSAIHGAIWKFMERISAKAVTLVVSIVLARLLTPEDYAPIGIITVFFAFCSVFITGGMTSSLVRKKDADNADYSTVLILNLVMATGFYCIMFMLAPWLARVYHKYILLPATRIMGLSLFINALKAVLSAYTSSNLQFQKFFFSTIIGTVFSAVVGIVMAIKGFGVWALLAQEMTNSILDTLILFITTRMKITWCFSSDKMKEHFHYGWKIMSSSTISVIYKQLNPLVIGIRFSPMDLSFYNKGNSFPELINATISDTLSFVLLPVMSKVQDNREDVLNITRRYIKTASYLIFPIMVGLFAVAETLVELLLTEKWLPAVPYIHIFAFSYMFNLIQIGNLQAIKAIGRSDLVLILEIITKSLSFAVIAAFVFLSRSAEELVLSSIVCAVISIMVYTYPNRKLIGYSVRNQMQDFLPNLLLSVGMGIPVFLIGKLNLTSFPLMFLQILVGVVLYLALSIITKNENYKYLLKFVKNH